MAFAMIFLFSVQSIYLSSRTAEIRYQHVFEFPAIESRYSDQRRPVRNHRQNKSLVIYEGTFININIASYTHDFLSVQIDFLKLAFSQYEFSVTN